MLKKLGILYNTCLICKGKKFLYKLNYCDHKFCKSCIKQWYYLDNRCPICSKKFVLPTNMIIYDNCKIFNNSRKLRIIPSRYFRKWEPSTCMYNKHFFYFHLIEITTNIRNILRAENKYTDKSVIILMRCATCKTGKYLPYEL